jgi:hypothetical protein
MVLVFSSQYILLYGGQKWFNYSIIIWTYSPYNLIWIQTSHLCAVHYMRNLIWSPKQHYTKKYNIHAQVYVMNEMGTIEVALTSHPLKVISNTKECEHRHCTIPWWIKTIYRREMVVALFRPSHLKCHYLTKSLTERDQANNKGVCGQLLYPHSLMAVTDWRTRAFSWWYNTP